MSMLSLRGLLTTATVAVCFANASTRSSAVPIPLNLVQEPAGTVGPQSSSNPCVIAATTCQQPATLATTTILKQATSAPITNTVPTTPPAPRAAVIQVSLTPSANLPPSA